MPPSTLDMFHFVSTNDFLARMALAPVWSVFFASLRGPCLLCLSLFGLFLWVYYLFPSNHSPCSRAALPRFCRCSHAFPPLVWILSINHFCFASAFMLFLFFHVFAPCYFLSVPNCFFLFLSAPPSQFCLPAFRPPKHSFAILVR